MFVLEVWMLNCNLPRRGQRHQMLLVCIICWVLVMHSQFITKKKIYMFVVTSGLYVVDLLNLNPKSMSLKTFEQF